MPEITLRMDVAQRGQLFNTSAAVKAITDTVDQIELAIADAALALALQYLGNDLQHPTGHYESRVTTFASGGYTGITDNGIAYGGWLEGVDPRNATTSFRGYHVFERVADAMRNTKEQIAQPLVNRMVQELNQ